MGTMEHNSVDSCISDFPYAIEFMNKNWDSSKCWNQGEGIHGTFKGTGYTGKKRPAFYQNINADKLAFYSWCYQRAEKLYPIMKPGGYVAIFGHPKTNHRMKCAFEDAGFKIVEEIDWLYLNGMPKCQDISKLFDKAAGAQRKVVGSKGLHNFNATRADQNHGVLGLDNRTFKDADALTAPTTELAKKYNGFKTAGLKPAHEPITIFQKPLEGTYIQNIEKYGCGGMNIDACRVGVREKQQFTGAKKGTVTDYGNYYYDKSTIPLPSGRFPANIILDEGMAKELDKQTGIRQSGSSNGNAKVGESSNGVISPMRRGNLISRNDVGGGSKEFTIIKYCPKVSPSERKLPNGERNPHVTLKPIALIKWLIKLLTPKDGTTIDITAGSCTHAVSVEELNHNEGYNLKYIDVELLNTKEDPYCNVGKMRVETFNIGDIHE